jgi:hypothetical protein
MKNNDYIPANAYAFDAYQKNFLEIVTQNLTLWNISPATITPLEVRQITWDELYPKADNPKNRTSADVLARQQCQAAYTKDIRTFANQQLMNNPLVTDADKDRLGLHVHSTSRHPAPDPTTSPVITKIDTTESQRHILHFTDESGGRAKPDGVQGCEIFMKKGEVPTTDADFTYAGTNTRSPFVIDFDASELGQTVHYKLRWINTRGKHGPWSRPVSAVVA